MSEKTEEVNGACLKAALALLKLGYWPVAIRPGAKAPIGKAWGAERWTEERLRETFGRYPRAGVGICFGPGRGPGGSWLIDVEGDGGEAGESLSSLLGGECVDIDTVSWNSARGCHYLFTVDGPRLLKVLASAGAKESGSPGVWHVTSLPGLEFRVGGTKPTGEIKQVQSVVPPTQGTDGKSRSWIGSPRIGLMVFPDVAYRFLDQSAPAVSKESGESYGRAALDRELADFASKSPGERHDFLLGSTIRLASLVKAGFLAAAEVIAGLHSTANTNGFAAEGRLPELDGLWHTALDLATPRQIVERNGHVPSANGSIQTPSRLIILASEVTPRRVEWLWPDRIPIGKLTTFAGWGGLGKSFVTMDLAARVSTGGPIPGMGGECFERSRVLILNTEDDPDDTSVPRLIEAGADLGQIAFARSEILGQFTLADLHLLDLMLAQLGDARLLVIDPATAHLGPANDHKNAELRALLMPLSLWAMERRIAVILVTHVNKPQGGRVEAMARVVGSVAWVNAVRAAVMFAKDPDDRTRRLFLPFKSNNAPERRGLAYRIAPTENLAHVDWLEEIETSADDALNPLPRKSVPVSVAAWVTARFREKSEWPSNDLKRMAVEAGISTRSLFKSSEVSTLPILKRQRADENGERYWIWIAESGWPKNQTESAESEESDS